MALTQGLQLPFGVQPVNPVPVDAWSGPYVAATEQDAIDAANAAITPAIRFQSMEVRLIIGGVSHKYWYRDGVADADLVEFSSGAGGGGGAGGLLTELVLNETPAGAIDGSNGSFTIANTPAASSTVMLWLNGQLLTQASDYTVAGRNITFLIAPPQTGDVLLSMYTKVVVVKQFAMNEVVAQVVIGGEPGLRVQSVPEPTQSLMLFRNGQLLTLDSDYTLTTRDIQFLNGTIEPEDVFLATYSYLG
jgi:hypothetical protein